MESKSALKSKTIWINTVMGVLAAIAAFVPQASGIAEWIGANQALIGVVWAGLNIGLRLITKDAVKLVD